MERLTFGKGNMKMKELATHLGMPFSHIVTFDLPAGWSCPKANACLSRVNRDTGKRTDYGQFVCYATKAESIYPAVRNSRWRNFDAIKACSTVEDIANLLEGNLPKHVEIVRIHSSGDFFSKKYFLAWVEVAKRNPTIEFFAYTKVLAYANSSDILSDNFGIVYSYGSKDDATRDEFAPYVPTCYVNTPENTYPVPVVCNGENTAHEDFYKIFKQESFAINFH